MFENLNINGIPDSRLKELIETNFKDAEGWELRLIIAKLNMYVFEFENLIGREIC